MKIKAILGAFNSKRDKYGNCYWAFRWTWTDAAEGVDAYGTISGGLSNLQSIAYALKLDPREVQVIEKELPIREFNRTTKGWPYAGCTSEELARFITSRSPAPEKPNRVFVHSVDGGIRTVRADDPTLKFIFIEEDPFGYGDPLNDEGKKNLETALTLAEIF